MLMLTNLFWVKQKKLTFNFTLLCPQSPTVNPDTWDMYKRWVAPEEP